MEYFPHREMGIALYKLGDLSGAERELKLSVSQEMSERANKFLWEVQAKVKDIFRFAQEDKKPPVIAFTDPVVPGNNTIVHKSGVITIKGKVTDESGVSKFLINEVPSLLKMDKTFSADCRLEVGENKITFKATDTKNNSSVVTLTVKREQEIIAAKPEIDRTPPTITITEPSRQRGMKVASQEKIVTVKGNAKDKSGIFSVTINNVEADVSPNGDFSSQVKLAVGDNTITVKAVDMENNVATEEFVVERTGVVAAAPKKRGRDGTDYAILFGGDQYQSWTPLVNPVNDVRTIGKELKENYGFETEIIENPTLDQMMTTLRKYRKKEYKKGDQLLIFVAGHGHYDKEFKMGYLVANDSRADDENKTSYLAHDVLRTIVDNIPSEHILLMLDVCHSGTFDQSLASSRGAGDAYGDMEKEEFVEQKMRYRTRKFITSGSENYVSDGLPGRHSPFARRVLEALRSTVGTGSILTVTGLYSYIERLKDRPHSGEFGSNEPGSDFLFIAK
jgi:hypothetical protein